MDQKVGRASTAQPSVGRRTTKRAAGRGANLCKSHSAKYREGSLLASRETSYERGPAGTGGLLPVGLLVGSAVTRHQLPRQCLPNTGANTLPAAAASSSAGLVPENRWFRVRPARLWQ